MGLKWIEPLTRTVASFDDDGDLSTSTNNREEPAAMVSVQGLGLWDSKWQVPYVQTNPSYSEKNAESFP